MNQTKKARFEVPYNGDLRLLDVIDNFSDNIELVYGRAEDGYPQGRNTTKQKPISLDEIEKINNHIEEKGIHFNYILNGNCHSNREFENQYRKNFVSFVRELKSRNIQLVTIGNPFLIELIKQEIPDMNVAASILLEVDNLERLKQIINLGIDYICLSKTLLKNFSALKEISKIMPHNIRPMLLANDPCLHNCAYTQYHNNILSHFTSEGGEYINYCRLHCNQDFASDPRKVISASFVRPEDLTEYIDLRFDLFKLCDRKQTTSWISNMLQAYVSEKYEGNLSDIMAPWSNIGSSYHFPSNVSENEILTQGFDGVRSNLRFSPIIDNRSMDGYLEYWKKYKSNGCGNENCDACNYCLTIAKRAYKSNPQRNNIIVKNIEIAQKTARKVE